MLLYPLMKNRSGSQVKRHCDRKDGRHDGVSYPPRYEFSTTQYQNWCWPTHVQLHSKINTPESIQSTIHLTSFLQSFPVFSRIDSLPSITHYAPKSHRCLIITQPNLPTCLPKSPMSPKSIANLRICILSITTKYVLRPCIQTNQHFLRWFFILWSNRYIFRTKRIRHNNAYKSSSILF